MTTVFHRGELQIQTESGVDQRTHKLGNKLIRDHIIDQHKEFFENLSYIFIALHDKEGRPWLSLIQGTPGFINSPNKKTLNLSGNIIAKDELCLQTGQGEPIGIVGLDFGNRRRNRLNGNLTNDTRESDLSILVNHSFGNCPKYIQLRDFEAAPTNDESPYRTEPFIQFNDDDIKLLEKADTFFIASSERQSGDLDANHRGGKPGFIRPNGNKQFWFNDYPGNNFFQTFGNINSYPNVGIMFIDFETGDLLLMCGKARLEKAPQKDKQTEGKNNFLARRCYFTLDKGIRVKSAIKGSWSPVELSPFLNKDLD